MFDGNWESLGVAVIGLIRLLAGAFLAFVAGAGASVVNRAWQKWLIVLGSVLLLMSGTYFGLTHHCASGDEDSDDSGRPSFVCTEWVRRSSPYAEEQSLAVGAVGLIAICMVMTWWHVDKTRASLKEIESRLDKADKQSDIDGEDSDAG